MKKTHIFLLLFLLFGSISLRAQSASAAPASAVQIALGHSVVALNGPWKFHTGDSPKVAGSQTPLWAQPDFDDSGWQDYTIDSKHPALTAVQALQSSELPGWQAHGHPGYTGYAWYRIQLQIPPDAHSLALLMPQYVDDAYEIYVNGQKIGGFGKLDGWHILYPPQSKLFSIPRTALDSGQPTVVAIRIWSQRDEAVPSEHNLDGGLRAVPLLGSATLLRVFQQSLQEQTGRASWRLSLLIAVYGAVGVISLFLFLFSRRQREYLWAGISLVGFAVMIGTIVASYAQQTAIPYQLIFAIVYVAAWPAVFAMPLAAMYLLGVPRSIWRRANYVVFALGVVPGMVIIGLVFGLLPPTDLVDRISRVGFWPSNLGLTLLLLAIAIDGLRTIGKKAWLLLTPGLLFAFYIALFTLNSSGFVSSGRFALLVDLVAASVPLAVLVIFLLRFTEQQRENTRLVDDMRQAQEIQQVLIPEELPQVPGLTIDSEYRPAQQVGGDFFQILPHPSDGSVLIVAGDVTGHGLQAGMLVALIVGAIRNQTETSFDPLRMLQSLNRRLCGRGHAHATCLALRIAADGAATLANAGHLPPYLNGKELPMEGALPLGMVASAEFSLLRFQLKENDRLILMSDGIAEAQDKQGHLFGFERIHDLLQKPITAAEVATAAQSFGQEDDISVLSVTRNANMKAAIA